MNLARWMTARGNACCAMVLASAIGWHGGDALAGCHGHASMTVERHEDVGVPMLFRLPEQSQVGPDMPTLSVGMAPGESVEEPLPHGRGSDCGRRVRLRRQLHKPLERSLCLGVGHTVDVTRDDPLRLVGALHRLEDEHEQFDFLRVTRRGQFERAAGLLDVGINRLHGSKSGGGERCVGVRVARCAEDHRRRFIRL